MTINNDATYEYISNECLLAAILGVKEETVKDNFSFNKRNLRPKDLYEADADAQVNKKIIALQALYNRIYSKECQTSNVSNISSPEDAASILINFFKENNLDPDKEHFFMIPLNVKNHVLSVNIVSIGSQTFSVVHPREVFIPAIEQKATRIIVAHNHPSGDPEPSYEDIAITKKLMKAGELLEITVLDHIIFDARKHKYESLQECDAL